MEALVELINASSDNLRLVVLNNCFSSIISEKIVDNIEASIGMNSSIGDQTSYCFCFSIIFFYRVWAIIRKSISTSNSIIKII